MSDKSQRDLDFHAKLDKVMDALFADAYPPLPIMKAKLLAPDPWDKVKSRDIRFIGFRVYEDPEDRRVHCLISASQMWTDEYFAELDAANPGPRGTPRGEQMKMVIPYEEVMKFFEEIKKQHDEDVAKEGVLF